MLDSARMPKLVSIILEAGAAPNFIEDYATCLRAHTVETEVQENPADDISVLILRVWPFIPSISVHAAPDDCRNRATCCSQNLLA